MSDEEDYDSAEDEDYVPSGGYKNAYLVCLENCQCAFYCTVINSDSLYFGYTATV